MGEPKIEIYKYIFMYLKTKLYYIGVIKEF